MTATTITAPGTAGQLARIYGTGLAALPLYGPEGSVEYDRLSRGDTQEIGELLRAARQVTGPVLDLACGSGRLTLPLLARGHDVWAADSSPVMLRLLTERHAEQPHARGTLKTIEADMSTMDFEATFGLVVLGTSSVCLLDEASRAALFSRVRQSLAPGGRFLVSTMDFGPELLTARSAERVSMVTYADEPGDTVITLFQHFDAPRGIRTTSLLRERVHNGQTTDRTLFVSEVYLVDSARLTAELADAGLRVIDRKEGADLLRATPGAAQPGQYPVLLTCEACT
ncbi:daptide-type RiPP biosynthesis methyltransferase [Amycolatopsis sp. NPDC059027]|uniref:daptide-type RiPP biosynthesis methyltransferase n=1 Tax=Amycolatopsis sp. NPDC059027 TaxID=3346709 RepID=UPI00366EB737